MLVLPRYGWVPKVDRFNPPSSPTLYSKNAISNSHPENFSDDLDRQALYFQKSSVSCFYLPLLFVDSDCWLLGHDVPELSVFRVAATSAARRKECDETKLGRR